MRLQFYALIGVTCIAALVGAVKYIQHDERERIELQRERDSIETLERINDEISYPRSPDAILERLRTLAE